MKITIFTLRTSARETFIPDFILKYPVHFSNWEEHLSLEIYHIFGNSYHISYRLNGSTSDVNIFVPLHPPSDTTSVTINY